MNVTAGFDEREQTTMNEGNSAFLYAVVHQGWVEVAHVAVRNDVLGGAASPSPTILPVAPKSWPMRKASAWKRLLSAASMTP